jgi:long-chain acyl-CoA synthetase
MGGRLRLSFSGGAALSPVVSKVFIGLGVTILQGYGLTEASPVISANRESDNFPESIGPAAPGVEVRLNEQGVLMVKGENVMLGYWKNPEATAAVIDKDGWLNTGDQAKISETGHIYITGRMKEIIVLSNGEKVPPSDMETAICRDLLFDQVMVIGEGKPFLAALVVINKKRWQIENSNIKPQGVEAEQFVLKRIAELTKDFPGYAKIHRVALLDEAWTVENGLLTATQKMRRKQIVERYEKEIAQLYKGH